MNDAPRLLPCVRSRGRSRDARSRLREVVAHLEVLLNTRSGSSLLDLDYGLPDLTDHMLSNTPRAAQVARVLERCVQRHEPRLSGVSVRAVSRDEAQPATLGFALTAVLADGSPLRLSGRLDRGAQVALEPASSHRA